jgi:signal transduction histidine kinase
MPAAQNLLSVIDIDMVNPPGNRSARILIVDDEEVSAAVLIRILEKAGYANCTAISDPALAVERFLDFSPDLLLLDLHMEPISGLEVLNRINELMAPQARPPVLVLTADTTSEAKHDALAAGATDFLAKPLDPTEVLLRIENLLTSRKLFKRCQLYSEGLERLVSKRTLELQQQTMDLEKAISELRETQRQVIQQERMRALGTMACGIAHDLNNGLTVILGYGDILLGDDQNFPEESSTRSYLEGIVLAACDNAKLVQRLREFYRPSTAREHRQPVRLNELIEQSISMTAPRWESEANAEGATVHIEKDLGEIPLIPGAPAELREVLTNLIFNAIDAMPRGGHLSFRTRQVGERIRIDVTDTGTGMSEETQQRCLEPFFTTKGDRGSGLGLAMSYGIIRRHGGSVEIKSKPDKGTTFTIYLPALSHILQPERVEPGETMRFLRVLVVDDEPAIQEIVSAYLAEDQHIVETAANAREALEKFRTHQFDLVITDRAMPEVNGDDLATSIKEIQPEEPVIMLTGFADLIEGNGRPKDVDLVLSKPARLDDLRRAILEVMSEANVSNRSPRRPSGAASESASTLETT